jgi:hypothetical protein
MQHSETLYNQLKRKLLFAGYTLTMEDKSLIDETQVYAIYKGTQRVTRLRTLDGVQRWSNSL